MTLFCPKCWAPAKCTDSRCNPRTNHVRRRHECQHDQCKHRFTTVEIIVGAVDLREQSSSSSLLAIAWDIFDQLGGAHADEQFLEAWAERHKAHQETKADREKGAPSAPKKKSAGAHPWRAVKSMPKVVHGG